MATVAKDNGQEPLSGNQHIDATDDLHGIESQTLKESEMNNLPETDPLKSPKFCCIRMWERHGSWWGAHVERLIYLIAALETLTNVAMVAYFISEMILISGPEEKRRREAWKDARHHKTLIPSKNSTTREWGITHCPSVQSSIAQLALNIIAITITGLLIVGKIKQSVYAIRACLVYLSIIIVGRFTVAGVWYQCASNLAVLPWGVFQICEIELLRQYHWHLRLQTSMEITKPKSKECMEGTETSPSTTGSEQHPESNPV